MVALLESYTTLFGKNWANQWMLGFEYRNHQERPAHVRLYKSNERISYRVDEPTRFVEAA